MLHLEHSGVAAKELSWPVRLIPPTCGDSRWLRPLVNRSACAKYAAHVDGAVCRGASMRAQREL